ncbi:MAG TPA: site-specific integrase [Acidimicrobiales bacterium]|nr:site-specific integrase [Acidimicrobiales bacterium]
MHSVVRAALEQGVRWGWLRENPAARASPGPGQPPEIKPPVPEAVLAMLQRAEQDDKAFAVFLVLAAMTGARRGELVALRWSDLDLERGALTITRAISEGVDGPVERPRPKTRGSVRRLALDEATVAILAAHRCRHAQAAAACGISLPGDAFVFSHEPDGSVPWKPGYVSLKFRRLRHSVGLDQVRLHDLRHFVATTLLGAGAGVDLQTVAGRLGHAGGGRTTLAVYSHFQQAADRNAADLLGKLLSSSRIRLLARRRGSLFLSVMLHCDVGQQVRRIDTPDRVARLKGSDPEGYRRHRHQTRLLQPPPEEVIQLDTTNVGPRQNAEAIYETLLSRGLRRASA